MSQMRCPKCFVINESDKDGVFKRDCLGCHHLLPNPHAEEGEKGLIAGIIQAQIGTRQQSDIIEEHMKEYFQRFASYQDRFTYLEWYHIFLDFCDTIDKSRVRSAPPEDNTSVAIPE